MPAHRCQYCGHENAPGADVCAGCGEQLSTSESVGPTTPVRPQPEARSAVLATFANQLDAQVATRHLEECGIPVVVNSDDCGGLLPPLSIVGGYQLLVTEADRARATEALQEIAAQFGVKPTVPRGYIQPPSTLSTPLPKPKPHLMMLGLFALGILAGGMMHYAWTLGRAKYTGTDSRDFNKDGDPDAWWTYRDGRWIELSLDRNFDGKRDQWTTFEGENSSSSQADDNFDGRVDQWYTYSNEVLTRWRFDVDRDGKPDGETLCAFGIPTETKYAASNKLGYWKRDTYTSGVLRESVIDTNRDGVLDDRVLFDPFGVILRVEPIK